MCMNSNNVSCVTAEHNNSPLVVSPCTRGSTCAAGVPAQFIIHMLPLSTDCDLLGWIRRQSEETRRQKKEAENGEEMKTEKTMRGRMCTKKKKNQHKIEVEDNTLGVSV